MLLLMAGVGLRVGEPMTRAEAGQLLGAITWEREGR